MAQCAKLKTEEIIMSRLQCNHCGAPLTADPSLPTIICPKCGKQYKNPYYGAVQTQQATHTVICPNCHRRLAVGSASAQVKCPCGKAYKNPYYDPAATKAAHTAHYDQRDYDDYDDSDADYEDENSYFDGGAFKYLGICILNALQLIFTLGLGYVWTVCRTAKWEINHRVVNGNRLVFTGTGGGMFGMWFGGCILTGLTLGLYYFKLKYKIDKYLAEHTHVEGEEDVESEFTADIEGKVGLYVINLVLTIITLGLYSTWATCREFRWNLNHQYISGHRLSFNGRGIQMFGNRIVWGLLIIVTIGIYLIFIPKKEQQFIAKHMAFRS